MNILRKYKFVFFIMSFVALTPLAYSSAGFLRDFDGTYHALNEYTGKGKWLIVMIWASDCSVCNKEAHQYVEFHTKHQLRDATVLGISLDGYQNKANAQEFIKKHSVNFPNLIDDPESIASMYNQLTGGTWYGTPTFLIYNPEGKLMVQQVGAVPAKLIEEFIAQESGNSTKSN